MNLKLLTAAALITASFATPSMAQSVYHRDYDRYDRYDRGPVGAAAGIAGAAVGTAAAIATSPFRNSYN